MRERNLLSERDGLAVAIDINCTARAACGGSRTAHAFTFC
jgi:hypothetical protein